MVVTNSRYEMARVLPGRTKALGRNRGADLGRLPKFGFSASEGQGLTSNLHRPCAPQESQALLEKASGRFPQQAPPRAFRGCCR